MCGKLHLRVNLYFTTSSTCLSPHGHTGTRVFVEYNGSRLRRAATDTDRWRLWRCAARWLNEPPTPIDGSGNVQHVPAKVTVSMASPTHSQYVCIRSPSVRRANFGSHVFLSFAEVRVPARQASQGNSINNNYSEPSPVRSRSPSRVHPRMR
jgi:hypothetical protein